MQQQLRTSNLRDTYVKQGVLTASPAELIIMLYDGLKKHLVLAKRAMLKREIPAAHSSLMRCQAIISELMNCLDMSFSMSKDLMNIYEFMLYQLTQANIKKDSTMLTPLLEITEELKDSWKEVASSAKGTMTLAD